MNIDIDDKMEEKDVYELLNELKEKDLNVDVQVIPINGRGEANKPGSCKDEGEEEPEPPKYSFNIMEYNLKGVTETNVYQIGPATTVLVYNGGKMVFNWAKSFGPLLSTFYLGLHMGGETSLRQNILDNDTYIEIKDRFVETMRSKIKFIGYYHGYDPAKVLKRYVDPCPDYLAADIQDYAANIERDIRTFDNIYGILRHSKDWEHILALNAHIAYIEEHESQRLMGGAICGMSSRRKNMCVICLLPTLNCLICQKCTNHLNRAILSFAQGNFHALTYSKAAFMSITDTVGGSDLRYAKLQNTLTKLWLCMIIVLNCRIELHINNMDNDEVFNNIVLNAKMTKKAMIVNGEEVVFSLAESGKETKISVGKEGKNAVTETIEANSGEEAPNGD